MSNKHVHWWDGEVDEDDSDNASFLPPSPEQSPQLASSADDSDSLVDSPSPPTPLTMLAPIPGIYQSRHLARGPPDSVRVSTSFSADARIRNPSEPHSPMRDAFNMSTMGRSVSAVRALGSLPHKSSDATLLRQPQWEASRSPSLHHLLDSFRSARTPALVWNVGDMPSYYTVLMNETYKDGNLIPVPPNILDEPATNPPLREMRIHCVGYSLWDPLLLRADEIRSPQSTDGQTGTSGRASGKKAKYIAVKHVIFAIYDYLHKPMSGREYDALKEMPTPDLQTSVAKSFYRRCAAEERRILAQRRTSAERGINVGPHRLHQKPVPHQAQSSPSSGSLGASLGARTAREGGLRRLDCLLGQTRFLSLSKVPGASEDWFVNVTGPSS